MPHGSGIRSNSARNSLRLLDSRDFSVLPPHSLYGGQPQRDIPDRCPHVTYSKVEDALLKRIFALLLQ